MMIGRLLQIPSARGTVRTVSLCGLQSCVCRPEGALHHKKHNGTNRSTARTCTSTLSFVWYECWGIFPISTELQTGLHKPLSGQIHLSRIISLLQKYNNHGNTNYSIRRRRASPALQEILLPTISSSSYPLPYPLRNRGTATYLSNDPYTHLVYDPLRHRRCLYVESLTN